MVQNLRSNFKYILVEKILHRSRYDFFVCISILTYAILFSYFTIQKHYGFATFAWDLGIFDQAFYTTLYNGKVFFTTAELYLNPSGCYFAQRFSPILFLLLPFYAIHPSAETLLVLKSFILPLGAFPLYLLSTELLKSKKAGFSMVIAYLMYPGLQGANSFDFQQHIFNPLLIFSLCYFVYKKDWKLSLAFVMLTLMVSEHMAVIIMFIALYYIFTGGTLRLMIKSIKDLHCPILSRTSIMLLITVALSAIWYIFCRFIRVFFPIAPELLETFRALDTFKILGYKGDIWLMPIYILLNPQQTLQAFLCDFHLKFLYMIFLFAPLLFLPFRSKLFGITLIYLIPILLSNYRPYYMLGAHYPLYILPVIFLAALEGLSRRNLVMEDRPLKEPISHYKEDTQYVIPNLKSIIIVSIIFILSVSPISPISHAFTKQTPLLWYSEPYANKEYVKSLHEMINIVPSNASILVQNNIFPHVSNRINAYVIPVIEPQSAHDLLKTYIRQQINKTEYMLLESYAFMPWTDFILTEITKGTSFNAYAVADNAVLLKKDYEGPIIFIRGGDHYLDYEVFSAYKDFLIYSGKIVKDETSKNGYVAFSEKGVNNGTFIYGPYVCLPPGIFKVTFEIKVRELNEGLIASFDVCDERGNFIFAKKDLYASDATAEGWSNVTITFPTNIYRTAVEFRIFTKGLADIYVDRVIVEKTNSLTFTAYRDFIICSGQIIPDETSKNGYVAFSEKGVNNGTFIYGPYVYLPSGKFEAIFTIKVGEHDEGHIARFDVIDEKGKVVLATKDLYGFEMIKNEWRNVTMTFSSTEDRFNYEFRIFASGATDIYVDQVIIRRISTVAKNNFGTMSFNYPKICLGNGNLTDGKILGHPSSFKEGGFFWFGPYITIPQGKYIVSFFIKVLPPPQEVEEAILTLDVAKNFGKDIFARGHITGIELRGRQIDSMWYKLTLEFEVEDTTENIEFRGLNPSSKYDIYLAYIQLEIGVPNAYE